MYQFPNLGELRDLAYRKADLFHTGYILAAGDLLETGLRYVQFAKEEPLLFKFLFQSGRFTGLSLKDLVRAPETAGVLSAVRNEENLTPEDAAAFLEPLAALVHGYASLIANNAMEFDPDAIRNALITIAEGLERKKSC